MAPDHELGATPSRRELLRGAGLTAAVLAGGGLAGGGLVGCADDGPGGGLPSTTTTVPPDGPLAGDLDLAIAAVTFENTTIALYRDLLEQRGGELAPAGLIPLLERFRDHHIEHAAALNRFLEGQGLDPVPPDRLFGGIDPLEEGALEELVVDELVGLLVEREDRLTQSYVDTLPRLTDAPLRYLVATVGAVEARHVTALDLELGGVAAVLTRAGELSAGRYPVQRSLLSS